MKKLLAIFLSFLGISIFSQSSQQVNTINLIARVEKIDSTNNSYIIYIKSRPGKAIFSVSKVCNSQEEYKYKIQKGKLYSFRLKKSLSIYGHQPKERFDKELVDNKIIWTSKMKRTFYEDCLNMCSLYIDNVGKLK